MKESELSKHRGCTTLPFSYEQWRDAMPYKPWEIDYEQPVNQMIRLNHETADFLYSDYTPLETHYEPGTRPELERHVAMATCTAKTKRDTAMALMEWICRKITCLRGMTTDLTIHGGTEEDFFRRGFGVCNEVSRVFVTLCQVAGIPARMTFHWTEDGRFGHSLAEAYIEGKWTLCDTEIQVTGFDVDGLQANCWELMTQPDTARAFAELVTRDQMNLLGLTDPSVDYSRVFKVMGLCNYPIEAFPYKHRKR